MAVSHSDSTPTAVQSGDDIVPTPLPARYKLAEQLGQGGMGKVYLAHDRTLDRPVAVKMLRALGAQHIVRLLAEAKAMARLSHPNVVHVYDVLTTGDGAVIVMELVQGKTLRGWLTECERTPTAIFEKFAQAGRGLHAAHLAGLIHLDFKPSNVLIGADGIAKVTDFGLARVDDFESQDASPLGAPAGVAPDGLEGGLASWGLQATAHGLVAGTPRYMAPEQHSGERCDRAADVFAFCVALWEALADAPPYEGDDLVTLEDAKRSGPPSWSGPALPGRLRVALQRGLEPDPARRWSTLEPILEALQPAQPRRRLALAGALGVTLAASAAAYAAFPPGATDAAAADPGEPPPLEGFGTDSPFGSNGERCHVQTLADAGEGSLRACLSTHAASQRPMEVVFDVGGTIALESELRVDTPFLSIDGITAPAPGVTLASATGSTVGLRLHDNADGDTCAHDVLVQGVRFLGTWDGTQHDIEQGATLELTAREVHDCMRNIVLNRVTLIASADAAGDMIGSIADVTVQYSAFLRSHHPMEITNRPGEPLRHARISLHHNVFGYFHERSPQLRGPIEDVDLVQNVFMNWNAYDFGGGYAIRLRCRDGDCPTRVNFEGNHWASGSGSPTHALVFGTSPEQDQDDGPISANVFMRDNVLPADNANFGLAPTHFDRPAIASVSVVDRGEYNTRALPWVGAPHRTDIEASVFDEVASRVANDQSAGGR